MSRPPLSTTHRSDENVPPASGWVVMSVGSMFAGSRFHRPAGVVSVVTVPAFDRAKITTSEIVTPDPFTYLFVVNREVPFTASPVRLVVFAWATMKLVALRPDPPPLSTQVEAEAYW